MAYVKKIWKDYPYATTPIYAEYLNNIENGIETVDTALESLENNVNNIENEIETIDTRLNDEEMYVQATAGANGDFFVNLTNQTLVNGRIVKISFPTATNSSSNAGLSIDNDTNYYNIINEYGRQVTAWTIENLYIELVFDGTNMRIINGLEQQVLLFEGSWSTGSITIPEDILNFKQVYITMASQGTYIGCRMLPTQWALNDTTGYVRGFDGYDSGSNAISLQFSATYLYTNLKQLTFAGCSSITHTSSSSHNARASQTVNRIIGIR